MREATVKKADQMKIRLPADLKAFVAAQAEQNGSSQNSEVIRAIRERKERVSPRAELRATEIRPATSKQSSMQGGTPEGRAD